MEELNSCELGTKEYWDKSYDREIKNFTSHGDCGEIWFDESSQFRVISWMDKCDEIQFEDSIIDLGTGNGMMLIELAREEYTNLTGVDYSEAGIDLAKKIAEKEGFEISYKVVDLLTEGVEKELGKFKICHDKGTYDAVSLMENPKEKREKYIKNIAALMNEDSYFIITSCNFTEEELLIAFESTFVKHVLIPTQTFKFGGKVGSVTTSLVLKKK